MTAVLDAPVTAVYIEEMLSIGLLRGAAGESKGDFLGAFPDFLFESCAFDNEGLTELGKVEVVVRAVVVQIIRVSIRPCSGGVCSTKSGFCRFWK